jgi:NifU-like protein involved in Fe-S cluster formation
VAASEWIKGKPMNEAISIKNRLVGFNVIVLNLELSKLLVCMSDVEVCWFCHKLRVQTVWMFCSDIAKHLSLPPVKLHCSMLAEDAIKAAVKDYRQKKEKLSVEAYVHVETAA